MKKYVSMQLVDLPLRTRARVGTDIRMIGQMCHYQPTVVWDSHFPPQKFHS